MEKHQKADAPRALDFHARPTDGLLAAMTDPALPVPPALPTGVSGHVYATDAQVAAWLTHHGLPVPDGITHT